MPTRRLLLAAPLVLAGAPARAEERLWRLLAEGRHVALMRHAEAPGVGDPPGFRLDECSTQRNLSEAGRRQAQRLGDRFRANGIEAARTLSSRWCRCLDTARALALGTVETSPEALDSFFENRAGRDRATAALKRLTDALTTDARPAVLVTHQVNVTALTGAFPGSGEIVVVAGEGYAVAGRLPAR